MHLRLVHNGMLLVAFVKRTTIILSAITIIHFSESCTTRIPYRFIHYRVLSNALCHVFTTAECTKRDPPPPSFRPCMINLAFRLFLSFVFVHHSLFLKTSGAPVCNFSKKTCFLTVSNSCSFCSHISFFFLVCFYTRGFL
jgi:hypothetical protein